MEIKQNYIYKNTKEDTLKDYIINNRKIFQFKELRLPIPQFKNTRLRFIIDQTYQEKTDILKVEVEQLDNL